VIEPDLIDRGDRRLRVGIRREEHLPRLGIELDRFLEKLRSRHLGHALVDEKERDGVAPLLELMRSLQRMPSGADLDDAVVGTEVLAKITIDGVQDLRIVVYGEDNGLRHWEEGGGFARKLSSEGRTGRGQNDSSPLVVP
jgi:hypothetical protein